MYPPLKNKNSLDFENKKDLQKTFPINFIPSLAFLPFMKTFLGDFIASLRVLFFLYRDLLFCSYREKHANGKFSNDFPIIRRREDERSPQLFPLCKALPIYLSCFNSVVWRYISWYILHMTLFMEWNETSKRISTLSVLRGVATTFLLLLLLGMLLGLEEAINYDIFIVQHGLLSGEYICVNKHLESPFGI